MWESKIADVKNGRSGSRYHNYKKWYFELAGFGKDYRNSSDIVFTAALLK